MASTILYEELPDAAPNARMALRPKTNKCQKEGRVTYYCDAINNVLKTYETDDVIAEAESNMMLFTQTSNKSHTEYTEALWNTALQCDMVYE